MTRSNLQKILIWLMLTEAEFIMTGRHDRELKQYAYQSYFYLHTGSRGLEQEVESYSLSKPILLMYFSQLLFLRRGLAAPAPAPAPAAAASTADPETTRPGGPGLTVVPPGGFTTLQ